MTKRRMDTPFGSMEVVVFEDGIILGTCWVCARDDDFITVDGGEYHVFMELRLRDGRWASKASGSTLDDTGFDIGFDMRGAKVYQRRGSHKLRERVRLTLEQAVNEWVGSDGFRQCVHDTTVERRKRARNELAEARRKLTVAEAEVRRLGGKIAP